MKPNKQEMADFLLGAGWKFNTVWHQWKWSLPPLRALYTIEDAYELEKSKSRSK